MDYTDNFINEKEKQDIIIFLNDNMNMKMDLLLTSKMFTRDNIPIIFEKLCTRIENKYNIENKYFSNIEILFYRKGNGMKHHVDNIKKWNNIICIINVDMHADIEFCELMNIYDKESDKYVKYNKSQINKITYDIINSNKLQNKVVHLNPLSLLMFKDTYRYDYSHCVIPPNENRISIVLRNAY